MIALSELSGKEKFNLVLGAVFGFIFGYFISPQHQDRSSRTKATIFQIVGALIGIVIVYGYISYKHNSL